MTTWMSNTASQRSRLRQARRRIIAVVPLCVWCMAIIAAYGLYSRHATLGILTGYAENTPVTIVNLEPGVVRKVYVDLYEEVVRGQMLVSLDDHLEQIRLAAIEKDIERLAAEVEAERAQLEVDGARSTADIEDLARRFAVDRETAHVEYLDQLVINASNRILLRGALVEQDILQRLDESSNATRRELNDISTKVDSLKATITKNDQVLERKEEAFQEADQRWVSFNQESDCDIDYDVVLTPLRLAIDVRVREIEEIVWRIDMHTLRSPIDGQITALSTQPGDRTQTGTPLVTVSPTSTQQAVVFVPEEMALRATAGMQVRVRCSAAAEGVRREYAGTIIRASAVINEVPIRHRRDPRYPMWGRGLVVSLDDDARLIPGEAVAVLILSELTDKSIRSEPQPGGAQVGKEQLRG